MDEIGDEFNDSSGDDETAEELPELTNESDELNEFDDDIPEVFSETDEFNDDIPEPFSETDEFDDDIPEPFSETDEFDDIIPERFSDTGEFDDIIPERFSDTGEFDDIIPERFSDTGEFDDIIPERFSDTGEFDDIIPERFSEPDEFDDILDATIHDKEVGERAEEDQDSDDVGNVVENENIGPQSTSTVLTSEIEEIESNMEHQEQEEEIEILPEEYQYDTEPIDDNTDKSEFIKDVEELAEYVRETKKEDENIEPQAEKENAAYYAEQYYEKLKEKEVVNDQNSIEEQETEELRQEVTEELNGDQESGYNSDRLEEEDIIKASKITSTEEFEYLWEFRDKLDREGKTLEEIEEVMHEAEEMYETLKNAEKLYEEQELEKLKLVDHEDEATEEDLKEELDRVDLVEQAIELEGGLFKRGELQDEIDARVEESIETTKFEENLEEIIEAQELEKLKLVDHEDEATEEDLKEELDRIDLVEQAIELEEKLFQQGELQDEIDARVEKSIETTKFEEKLEKIIEEQEREKLKLIDHEDEASVEDLKEKLDRVDLIEQAIELEENLVQQGELQEEIDIRVEESIETTKFEEKLETIIEQQELEKLKLVNHEDKASVEDLKEDLDRIDLVEQAVELEEELVQQGESQEEIDVRVEESIETTMFEEKLEEIIEEQELDLQELYRQETSRRPIYARKKTKGYSLWLEQRELGAEKIKISKSESEKIKEIEEEDWKTTLIQWIKEASEEECNAELKYELKKSLESYNKFEDLTRKFLELYEKSQYEKLTEKEKNILKSLTKRLQELDPIQLELLANIRAFKDYFNNQYWYDFWNKPLVNRARSKFFKHIRKKINLLNKKSSIDPTEEKYSKRLKRLADKLFKYNRSIINKISKEFKIDILSHSNDNYLTGEFLDNVDKLTTEFLEYIYNKFQSYEKAVNYFIKLIAKNRTYDFTLKYSKYISSSIIFYLFRINVITIKPIFKHFSFNTFKDIFSSEFNLDSFKKIFIEIYRNIMNMDNKPPIFLTLTCEKTTLFNLYSYRDDVLRFLKIYHNIIFHYYQLDENDSFEKASQLLYDLIKYCQDSLKKFYEMVNKTKPRLISASILFYFVQLKNPNLRFPEFASYLHIGERSLPKPVSLICNLLQSLPNADPINYHTIISYKGYKSLIKKYTKEFKIPQGEITPLEIFNDLLKSLKLEDLDLALENIILKLKLNSLSRSPYHIFSVLSFMSYNYYCLSNHLKFLKRKDFIENFRLRNTSVQSLRTKVTFFIKLLLSNSDFVSKYSFLLSFVTGRYLDEIQYRYSLIYFCDIFLEQNTLLDFFEIRKENLNFIKSEIIKFYDEMISRKNFNLFYQTLPKEVKNPKFVATFLIFFYFSYIKGYFIDIRFFLKLLEKRDIWKTFPIDESKLYRVKKALIDSFFKKFTKQLFNNVMSKINFFHQGITYTFHPAISRLKIINPELSKGLYFLFLKIASDSFPNNFFNNPTYRPSDFMLKGNHSERLNFSTISQYFDKFIVKHRNFHGLSSEITKFISSFRNKYHKNPDHPPILNFIMKKYTKNAISTETPIWKSINEIENICGHIDLLIVFGNTLYICDYKPTLKEIYRKIPQLALYGNIIKSMLSRFCDISQFSIKCLGLCPNYTIEFNTNIKYELVDFVSSQNKIREDTNRMSTRNGQDLEESLKKAIFYLERNIKDF